MISGFLKSRIEFDDCDTKEIARELIFEGFVFQFECECDEDDAFLDEVRNMVRSANRFVEVSYLQLIFTPNHLTKLEKDDIERRKLIVESCLGQHFLSPDNGYSDDSNCQLPMSQIVNTEKQIDQCIKDFYRRDLEFSKTMGIIVNFYGTKSDEISITKLVRMVQHYSGKMPTLIIFASNGEILEPQAVGNITLATVTSNAYSPIVNFTHIYKRS